MLFVDQNLLHTVWFLSVCLWPETFLQKPLQIVEYATFIKLMHKFAVLERFSFSRLTRVNIVCLANTGGHCMYDYLFRLKINYVGNWMTIKETWMKDGIMTTIINIKDI